MKTDSRIIISIDKQFYSDDDEIRIHVWFNHSFYSSATLTVLSPTGRKIDSSGLQTDVDTTETFAFTCGGPFMFENGITQLELSAKMSSLKQCLNIIAHETGLDRDLEDETSYNTSEVLFNEG